MNDDYFEVHKKMYGFDVYIDGETERGNMVTSCHITKGNAGSSLELAKHVGELEDGDGGFVPISDNILAAIEKFAYANGY